MLEGSIDLTMNYRAIVTRNRFLTRNISHTKRFSDSRGKQDAARENEKCLKRNNTHIVRNETRSGNLLLSGTVSLYAKKCVPFGLSLKYNRQLILKVTSNLNSVGNLVMTIGC